MNVSISRRLALMFAACGCVVFLLVSIVLRAFLCNTLELNERAELLTRAELHETLIRRTDGVERWTRLRDRLTSTADPDGSTRYWILSEDPRYTFGDWPAQLPVPPLDADADGYGLLQLPGEERPRMLLLRGLPANGERAPVRLLVAVDRGLLRQTVRSFTTALVALSAAGIVLVAGLGYLIARYGLQPLRLLARDAQQLSPSKLSQRIGSGDLPPELAQLASSFNGALDRLEQAYQQLEAFNVDVRPRAAHAADQPDRTDPGGAVARAQRRRTRRGFAVESGGTGSPACHRQRHAVPRPCRQRRNRPQPRRQLAGAGGGQDAGFPRSAVRRGRCQRGHRRRCAGCGGNLAVQPGDEQPAGQRRAAHGARGER